MMPPPDVSADVGHLRDRVMGLELSMTKNLGDIEATVRVVKHDNANTQQMVVGLNTRLDRFENQFRAEIKELSETLSKEVRAIGAEIATSNTNNQRKFSFYAGIAAAGTFIVTISGVIITAVAKLMP